MAPRPRRTLGLRRPISGIVGNDREDCIAGRALPVRIANYTGSMIG